MARTVQVTLDAADPGALAAFWAEALGYELEPPPPPFETWDEALDAWGVPDDQRNSRSAIRDPEGVGPRVFFQQVSGAEAVKDPALKNRVHLDVRAAPGLGPQERMAALAAEAERLVALGATVHRRHDPVPPTDAGHLVMLDPEGNEFCLD